VSDCHLGTGAASGPEEAVFGRLVDLAVSEDVDAVVVAGDLFDNARVPAQLVAWTAGQLARLGRPAVVLPGNHDHDVLGRLEPETRGLDVHIVRDHDGEVVDVPGTAISVWARAMVRHEPAFRPLAGLPPRSPDRWCIAAGHGLVVDGTDPFRSSPIRAEDLALVDWDYVALGHVHEYREVEAPVPACYAGVGGAVVVDLIPDHGARPRWVPLDR